MAADLDAALGPGETIRFRASGRSYRRQWAQFGSAIAGLSLLLAIMLGFKPEYDLPLAERFWAVSVVLAAVACPWALALLVQASRQRRSPDELVITDRRLMFSEGRWTRKFDSVDLDKIQAIERTSDWDSSGITIESEDQILRLPRFGSEPDLAARLTDATGFEPLPDIGRLVDIDLRLLGYSIACSIGYLPLLMLVAEAGLQIADERLFGLLLDTIPIIGGSIIGIALGALAANLLTVTVMCRFVTAEQMRAGLVGAGGNPWQIRPSLLWAGLLYGRPLTTTNG